MEEEFLNCLDFNISISEEEFDYYYNEVSIFYL